MVWHGRPSWVGLHYVTQHIKIFCKRRVKPGSVLLFCVSQVRDNCLQSSKWMATVL